MKTFLSGKRGKLMWCIFCISFMELFCIRITVHEKYLLVVFALPRCLFLALWTRRKLFNKVSARAYFILQTNKRINFISSNSVSSRVRKMPIKMYGLCYFKYSVAIYRWYLSWTVCEAHQYYRCAASPPTEPVAFMEKQRSELTVDNRWFNLDTLTPLCLLSSFFLCNLNYMRYQVCIREERCLVSTLFAYFWPSKIFFS